MATGGTGGAASLQADAVPSPDNDPPRKKGYQLAIFERKVDQKELSCGLCSKIVREPVKAECGHWFCQNCQKTIEKSVAAGKKELCKFCKDEGVSDEESTLNPEKMFPDHKIKKEMARIKCECPSVKCVWSGPCEDYIEHLKDCPKVPEPKQCNENIPRDKKYKGFPVITCEKCEQKVPKKKIGKHRNKKCSQRIIRCEHCYSEIPYIQKVKHEEDCKFQLIKCEQCGQEVSKKKIDQHRSKTCAQRVIRGERCHTEIPYAQKMDHDKDCLKLSKSYQWGKNVPQDKVSKMPEEDRSFRHPTGTQNGNPVSTVSEFKTDEIESTLTNLEVQVLADASGEGRAAATGGVTGGSGGDQGAEASAIAVDDNAASTDHVSMMESNILESIQSLHEKVDRFNTDYQDRMNNLEQQIVPLLQQCETRLQELEAQQIVLQQQCVTLLQELEACMSNMSQNRKTTNYSQVPEVDKLKDSPTVFQQEENFDVGPVGACSGVDRRQEQHASSTANGSGLPYIVIDGSNMAMEHGDHKVYSCRGIELCVNHYVGRGHRVKVLVSTTKCNKNWRGRYPIVNQEILERLRDSGYLRCTPTDCDEDYFLLCLAIEKNGMVISNDKFRDYLQKCSNFVGIRVLPYVCFDDSFIPYSHPRELQAPQEQSPQNTSHPMSAVAHNPSNPSAAKPQRRGSVRTQAAPPCPYSSAVAGHRQMTN